MQNDYGTTTELFKSLILLFLYIFCYIILTVGLFFPADTLKVPATYFWVPTGQLRATCFVLSVITFQRCTLPQFLWREYMTAVFCIANMQKKREREQRTSDEVINATSVELQ